MFIPVFPPSHKNPDNPPPFIFMVPWRSEKKIVLIRHLHANHREREFIIATASREKLISGSELVISKPVSLYDAQPYYQCGFEELQWIILLGQELNGLPPTRGIPFLKIKRFRKDMLHDVLLLDSTAFDLFWRLDSKTLLSTASQCRRNLFLVGFVEGKMVAYAVGGVTGNHCYLQRLCVHPSYQGMGIGREMALNILRWARNLGACDALVNTQEGNDRALGLYYGLGFMEMDKRVIMGKERENI